MSSISCPLQAVSPLGRNLERGVTYKIILEPVWRYCQSERRVTSEESAQGKGIEGECPSPIDSTGCVETAIRGVVPANEIFQRFYAHNALTRQKRVSYTSGSHTFYKEVAAADRRRPDPRSEQATHGISGLNILRRCSLGTFGDKLKPLYGGFHAC